MTVNFKAVNPATVFIYIIGAIFITFSCQNPILLMLSLLSSITVYFMQGQSAKSFVGIGIMALMIVFFNFIFNGRGSTILFYVMGRAFTLQAIIYGLSSAVMFISAIVWFLVFSKSITSEKLLYILAPISPSITVILTLILRLIPLFLRRLNEITQVQKTMQSDISSGSKTSKIKTGFHIFSVLLMWCIEDCFDISASMTARGYGASKRTYMKKYRFHFRDFAILICISATLFVYLSSVFTDSIFFIYYPVLINNGLSGISVASYAVCFIYFAMPIFMGRYMFE